MQSILSVATIGQSGLRWILERAIEWKCGKAVPQTPHPLGVFLLERPTLRTRLAYEAALMDLGGRLVPFVGQLESRESLDDVARVLSRMSDVILARVRDHRKLEVLAEAATVPVINALSSREHPVEVLADALVLVETFGDLAGKKIAFVGDGGNVCHSLVLLAPLLGMNAAVASPEGYAPNPEILGKAAELASDYGCTFDVESKAESAVAGACAVYTDGWPIVGNDPEATEKLFGPYRVDEHLMARAKPDAIFLHCLPARRGCEVSDGVIDGPQSRAFDRLENLRPTSAATIEWVLGDRPPTGP